jgi:hypothetical protein
VSVIDMRLRRSNDSRERGQALVEFALVIPVVLLLIIGLFDLGRAVYAYNSVSNAARTGARVAIVDQTPEIQQEAIRQAVSLGLAPVEVAVQFRRPDPNPDPMDNALCASLSIGCVAVVCVQYSYTAATPIIGAIVGPFYVSSVATMPLETVLDPAAVPPVYSVPSSTPCDI